VSGANIHATAVAFGPSRGVLILGASGSGKSRLALNLIDKGAQLVADDQVFLAVDRGNLFARAPQSTAGLIEVRGLGILRLGHRWLARIVLVIDMEAPGPRLSMPVPRELAGVTLPCLPGVAEASFAAALARYVTGSSMAV
jgi:HPr kinase/phosphorylase